MKTLLIHLTLLATSYTVLLAQTSATLTETIMQLELEETKAIVARNFDLLKAIWADDFMVNNPSNSVVKSRKEVMERMEQGVIHYSEFTRKIESVMVLEGLVIVMGEETVKPIGQAPMAGQTVKRRYTNIWREKDGKWQVQARHANIICAPR
jgi:ketosteroid isomerase-like protein